MRTLALSLGNTSLFGAVFTGSRAAAPFRFSMREPLTREEFIPQLNAHVRGPIDRAVLCSVVPAHTRFVARQVRRAFGIKPLQLANDAPHGLTIAYRDPMQLGTDRLAAALGARVRFPSRDIVVVDCGTATTVTALRRDGTILGGAIFPGVGLWSDALATRTAQLPHTELRRPRAAVGRSPREAIQSGIYFGHLGAIDELVRRVIRESFGRRRPLIVGTGGNAVLFAREKLFTVQVPDLILAGLNAYAARHFDRAG